MERCFDLSRSVDLHLISATDTGERAISGITKGLMHLNDFVTWEASHFWIKWNLTSRIVEFNRPKSFTDNQANGPFKDFRHRHSFEAREDCTVMKDECFFECPFGILGNLADPIIAAHLKKFLIRRNQVIKETAEGEAWRRILSEPYRGS